MILTVTLPDKGKPLVKVGQRVNFDTSLYEGVVKKEIRIIISEKLKVPSSKIFRYIKKVVGDMVTEGEVLAEKKSLFNITKYKSEWDGILKEINHTDGSVIVEVSGSDRLTEKAFFCGEVAKIEKNELSIKVEKVKEYDMKEAAASSFGGKVFFYKHESNIDEEMVRGCVVVVDRLTSYAQMKLEALGVVGYISLHSLPEKTTVPHCLFKVIKDYDDSLKQSLPYCFSDSKTSKIIFYR